MNLPPKIQPLKNKSVIKNKSVNTSQIKKVSQSVKRRSPMSPGEKLEALPVLDAFQEFLEAERRRTKVRLLILIIFFFLLLLSLTGGGLFVGMTFFSQLEADFKDLQEEVTSIQDRTLKLKERNQLFFPNIKQQIKQLLDDVHLNQQTQAIEQLKMTANMDSYNNELNKLRETINSLRSENNILKSDFIKLTKNMPDMSNNLESIMQTTTRLQSQDNIVAPHKDASNDTINLLILPRGKEDSISWRIPIPE